jgi:hypothetical protein
MPPYAIPICRFAMAGALTARMLTAQTACGSFVPTGAGDALDLAPPVAFVEICSQDARLCDFLTRGFPASLATVGYFVATPEWEAHQRDPTTNFDHYLIAQLPSSATPADLPGLKAHIHAYQGAIPDHTQLPSVLKSDGRVGLGVLDETDSSITFGTVMQLRRGAEVTPIQLVATNSALVVNGRLVSLYAYRTMHDTSDIGTTVGLTKTWLDCIRRANSPPRQPR